MSRSTPISRIGISLAVAWLVLVSAYGFHGSRFYFYTYQRGMEAIEASCEHLLDEERANCVASKMVVGDGPFWRGRPLWQIFKFLLLPPVILLGSIWFWPEISGGLRRLVAKYARWIKGDEQTPP